jgi:hypothetical protein
MIWAGLRSATGRGGAAPPPPSGSAGVPQHAGPRAGRPPPPHPPPTPPPRSVPHACQYVGAFQDSRQIYIVMEHAGGGDLLETLLREGHAMTERRAVREVRARVFEGAGASRGQTAGGGGGG